MSEQRFPNQHVKNVLDGNNLSISAPCPSADKKWSSLNFRVTKGNPRIIIYTNDPNDTVDHGRIVVKMHPISFAALVESWEKAITQEAGWKETIEIEDYTWRNRERSEKPEVTHKIFVGKDQDGVISLLVLDAKHRDRPRIKFEIKAPRFVRMIGANGEPMTKAEESVRFSEIWVKILRDYSAQLAVTTWEEPKKRDNNQGGGNRGGGYGGGGGYRNNNDNGGGGGRAQGGDRPSNNDDDDFDSIPF